MSSRVFEARTSHTPDNPQLCGLTGHPIQKGDLCFYLVCEGDQARPEWQVRQIQTVTTAGGRGRRRKTRKVYESNRTGRPFRCTWTGEWEEFEKQDGSTGRRRVYEWQVEQADGSMKTVEVWSNMVHVEAAEQLGYDIPKDGKGKYRKTKAHRGDRTQGHEHKIAKEAENPLLTLAKAGLSPEERGEVAPQPEAKVEAKPEPEAPAEPVEATVPVTDPDEEDRLDAEALGITLEDYRKLLGR